MAPAPHNPYLMTDVNTASQQKLQWMLFDAAVRYCQRTKEYWRQGLDNKAWEALRMCLEVMAELFKGLRPEQDSKLVGQVSSVYLFVYRSLLVAQANRDEQRLDEALRVLEIERETWRQVCEKLQQRPAAPHFAMDNDYEPTSGFSALG